MDNEIKFVEELLGRKHVDPNYIHHKYKVCI